MFPDLFASFACATDPFGCANNALNAQPWYILVVAGIVAGMLLGAWLGKIGVGVALASVVGILLFWRQRGPAVLEEGDMDPPVRPKKPKPAKPKGPQFPPDVY